MENEKMATSTNGNGTLIDEFEESFHQCVRLFVADDGFNNNSFNFKPAKGDSKLEIDQATIRVIEAARQCEAYFLQKRFLLNASKPEWLVNDDTYFIKVETMQKDELIERYRKKVLNWQKMLSDINSSAQQQQPRNNPPPGLSPNPIMNPQNQVPPPQQQQVPTLPPPAYPQHQIPPQQPSTRGRGGWQRRNQQQRQPPTPPNSTAQQPPASNGGTYPISELHQMNKRF